MEDKVLEVNRKKLSSLDKQLADLAVKQRRVEKQLADEHDRIRQCASQRTALVAQLVDAAPEQASKVHKQLDSIDATITGSERMAESFQALLRSIAAETATLTSERNRLNEIVGAEVNQREFALWTVTMTENFKAARAAMAAARIALARCTVEAAKGAERFKGAASTWAAGEFDAFERVEANPDTLGGFKLATPWYRNTVVHIHPMVRA